MEKKHYAGWALSTIALIAQDKRVGAEIRCNEILCVIHHDGLYTECFDDGYTPQEAWDSEVEAILHA